MTTVDDARHYLEQLDGIPANAIRFPLGIESLRAAVEALDAVLALHAPGTVYALADECGHADDGEHGVEGPDGERFCPDSPTGELLCQGCRRDDFGEPMPWPCPTALAAGAKAPEEASS